MHCVAFTDLGDVHDFDGRQLARLDMSTLERKAEERKDEGRLNVVPTQRARHHSSVYVTPV